MIGDLHDIIDPLPLSVLIFAGFDYPKERRVNREMKEGAVVMIDALGFRGIWPRWPADVVLADMHTLKERLEQAVRDVAKQPDLPLEATFLSDTCQRRSDYRLIPAV
jgi:hypothetical protein